MRSIASKVAAKPFASNTDSKASYRVIGTVDINNKGTEHPLADVDPFIFLDETTLRGDQSWPFPKHPHYGLVAMTYMLSGEMTPWDNKQGKNKNNNRAGGIYYINSGHGILHEEEPVIAGGQLRWLQLWMNPGIYGALPDAFTVMVKPEDVTVQRSDAGMVRTVIGDTFKPDWPIQYLHVTLQPGKSMSLSIPETDWQGFIYILQGSGEFGSNKVHGIEKDCLVLGKESATSIEAINNNSDILDFVFLSGKPHNKPFYKILGGGGALIAGNEEEARKALEEFNQKQDKFG